MSNLTDACAHSERLIKWYWDFGCRRVHHQLPPQWLTDVYRQRDAAKAMSASQSWSDKRRTLAVWGPSQSGKSMLLSRFLDGRDEPGSALTWKAGQQFRFKPSSSFPDVETFNPHKNGTDASGCVTRFYLAEQVDDPDHPVEIRFCTRRQVYQAITAGYLLECRQELPGGGVVEIDEDFIRRELDPTQTGSPEQTAVEHIVDVVSVVDRLLPDEYPRFNKLKRGGVWERELLGSLVADLGLASSRERAVQLGRKLLWDSRQRLNALADKLDRSLDDIARKFQDKRVICSLEFAAKLVDIDTYGVLAGDVPGSRNDLSTLLLDQITYVEYPDRVVLGTNETGKPLFKDAEAFGLFQGLIWELALPLNASYFRAKPELSAILSFLEQIEILDVPGVAKDQPGPDRMMFDLESAKEPTSVLLSKVFKRGRTATIINRYAEQLRVDGVLLLNVAGNPPTQPKQLVPGIEAIWRAVETGYNAGEGHPPPVPLAICLTFMGQKINENVQAGIDRMNLGTFDATLAKFGDLAKPGVSQIFVTTYPDVPGAGLMSEAREPKVRDAVLRQNWIAERFLTPPEKNSWRALLQDDDGGIQHLLGSLAVGLSGSSRERRMTIRTLEISKELMRLTRAATPLRNLDGRQYSKILLELVDRLTSELAASRPQDNAASALSWQLRRLMSFEAQDFDALPRRFERDLAKFEVDLKKQVDRWANRPSARQVLTEMNVSDGDQILLLDALRGTIDPKSIASWAAAKIGPIETERQALHMRRYLAAKCAEQLVGPATNAADEPKDNAKLSEQRYAKFNSWIKREHPKETPHFDVSVAPLLQRLTDIADMQIAADWDDQPGDDDIEALAAQWAKANAPRAAGLTGEGI